MKDFYYILGTGATSTPTQIEEAYDKLSKALHPRLAHNNKYLENQYNEIREAYEVLSDNERRRQYDEELNRIKSHSSIIADKKGMLNSKTKTIDITFTVILGLITLVFGNYVRETLSGSKTNTVKKAPAVKAVAFHKTKHHRKKHSSKIKAVNYAAKHKLDTTEIKHPRPAPITVKNIISENDTKIVNDIKSVKNTKSPDNANNNLKAKNSTINNASFLYTAYIKANETGVINLRKFDNYGSEIIRVIPANSKVFVLEKGNTYYKVMFDNSTGYVPGWTVQTR